MLCCDVALCCAVLLCSYISLVEHITHLVGNIHRHLSLSFLCGGSEVGGAHQVRVADELVKVFLGWLRGEHVQSRRSDMSLESRQVSYTYIYRYELACRVRSHVMKRRAYYREYVVGRWVHCIGCVCRLRQVKEYWYWTDRGQSGLG